MAARGQGYAEAWDGLNPAGLSWGEQGFGVERGDPCVSGSCWPIIPIATRTYWLPRLVGCFLPGLLVLLPAIWLICSLPSFSDSASF